MTFLATFTLNFHSDVCKTTTFCFKMYSPCKTWKKPIDNAGFFTFFYSIGPTLAQFLLQGHTHFDFLLVSSTDINNNFNWNLVVLKKISKTFKNYHFLAQLEQKWSPHGPPTEQTNKNNNNNNNNNNYKTKS